MHNKEITVTRIAQSNLDLEGARHWIKNILGFEDYEIPELNPAEGITPAALIVMMAAKRCYMAFDVGKNLNLTRVRTDLAEYLENIFKAGHGSVLEHVSFTYAIEGVTRVFTGEMNRHRAGVAISEGSMRYIRLDDLGFWMPDIFQESDDRLRKLIPASKMTDFDVKTSKEESQSIMKKAFLQMEANVAALGLIWDVGSPELGFGAKKLLTSAFRRVIGMGVSTGGVWTVNIRALRHILTMRGEKTHAEEEIYRVADLIADDMSKSEPLLFGDFHKDPTTGVWSPLYPKV